ncbi:MULTISPECIES: XrtA/PEP-CTERM system exopolysaccharide export protein [unclassified Marinobacter]|jgi:polysaccharide export outer membrane protein|uniref:XrtA/PEP-CTERM system exopolysaccharide export protein n=1 Tax=unclassified Marinobacter TaxID=83889 RepID=UPI00200BDC92|nr:MULTISPECIES: XrtA/PEP-CTERM system exopolysaccharide export protein [unclassified Marinobacter]MCL1479022.1 polysaccharide biosynthesis/export family protein [Marinobacter sp.]UQG54179.1 polysaccharide biosynthesis/export family protein [Marinobacter sp. M4C]UQG62986.1 polysaccharide biosynthesis/export family protein [Marinobacter sp. M2C]UQG67264.1 polysaccharide biosynthesis/export family protein [Marinobacter sp. M1C]
MGRFKAIAAVCTALFTVVLAGCSGLPSSAQMPPSSETETEAYEIGVGDTIAVHVWRNPELNQTIVVRPDGFISMPLMGDVKAEGKRPEELASEVDTALSEFIRTPEVTVMVTSPASKEFRNRLRITGQVAAPQSVAFQPGMTVLDLVLIAGGVTDFAADGRAVLHRQVDGEYKSYGLDLSAILTEGDMQTNHTLQPGDVISVPRKQLFRGEL